MADPKLHLLLVGRTRMALAAPRPPAGPRGGLRVPRRLPKGTVARARAPSISVVVIVLADVIVLLCVCVCVHARAETPAHVHTRIHTHARARTPHPPPQSEIPERTRTHPQSLLSIPLCLSFLPFRHTMPIPLQHAPNPPIKENIWGELQEFCCLYLPPSRV